MPQIEDGISINSVNQNMDKIEHQDFDFLLLIGFVLFLFLLAPLYYHPNTGGRGLELTFNISTWAVAISIICFAIYLVTARQVIRLPQKYLFFVAVPVVIILNNLVTGTSQPVPFFFRELFILGGLFYFFALFQFKLRPYQIEGAEFLATNARACIFDEMGTVVHGKPKSGDELKAGKELLRSGTVNLGHLDRTVDALIWSR